MMKKTVSLILAALLALASLFACAEEAEEVWWTWDVYDENYEMTGDQVSSHAVGSVAEAEGELGVDLPMGDEIAGYALYEAQLAFIDPQAYPNASNAGEFIFEAHYLDASDRYLSASAYYYPESSGQKMMTFDVHGNLLYIRPGISVSGEEDVLWSADWNVNGMNISVYCDGLTKEEFSPILWEIYTAQ